MLSELQQAFETNGALKIISGLTNYEPRAGCCPLSKQLTRVVPPSSISPQMPTWCVWPRPKRLCRYVSRRWRPRHSWLRWEAGADLIEIGNFDAFYAQGRRFEAPEVLALTRRTRELLPHHYPIGNRASHSGVR